MQLQLLQQTPPPTTRPSPCPSCLPPPTSTVPHSQFTITYRNPFGSIDNWLSFRDIVVCRASDAAPSTLSDDSADWETRGDVVSALVAGVHLTALAADTTPPADQPGPAAPAAAATAAAGDAAIEDAVDGYATLPYPHPPNLP